MMDEQLRQALQICPVAVRESVAELAQKAQLCVEEVRLRAGKCVTVFANGREWKVTSHASSVIATQQMIAQTVACAAEYSVYNAQQQLSRGFCTLSGGHRLGICGEAVCDNGRITTLNNFSSLNLRVAHEVFGAADRVIDLIWSEPGSVLLFGAPGSGKTTVLRDCVRQLSDRLHLNPCVVDERFEIAGCVNALPQFEVGSLTDVLSGAPKKAAVLMLLRTMRPQWIAVDEITDAEDVRALTEAAYCGVNLIATVHAAAAEDLSRRRVYRELLDAGVFTHFVRIDQQRNLISERISL